MAAHSTNESGPSHEHAHAASRALGLRMHGLNSRLHPQYLSTSRPQLQPPQPRRLSRSKRAERQRDMVLCKMSVERQPFPIGVHLLSSIILTDIIPQVPPNSPCVVVYSSLSLRSLPVNLAGSHHKTICTAKKTSPADQACSGLQIVRPTRVYYLGHYCIVMKSYCTRACPVKLNGNVSCVCSLKDGTATSIHV